MNIESKKVTVAAEGEVVFDYIIDLNNFKNLLPADRISEWESNSEYCSFKVQGTATIDLHLKESERPNRILLESGERSPFSFNLEIFLDSTDGSTTAYQLMTADINPFLKMMVEKPLTNLFDYIADRLVNEIKG
ncbi:MAG: hypothetical protein ABR572_02755 [Cryomorphaceae bacterium]|nr:hypothetical protein [Flavobacteriales bacterium]